MKLIAGCLLLLCLSAALVRPRSFTSQDDIKSYTEVGQPMPSFTVTELGGEKISVGGVKGKVMLVNFWATWCPPCRVEMPRLEKEVWRKYKSDDFVMIAIAREQTAQEINAFRKEYGFSFPMASDPQREVYKLFGNGGIPRSYVVDGDGKILFQSIGYTPTEFDEMKAAIETALKKVREARASQ